METMRSEIRPEVPGSRGLRARAVRAVIIGVGSGIGYIGTLGLENSYLPATVMALTIFIADPIVERFANKHRNRKILE